MTPKTRLIERSLKDVFDLLVKRYERLSIVELPGVPIKDRQVWETLPDIPAVYFLWSTSGRSESKPRLFYDSKGIGHNMTDCWAEPCLLYVGKAVNLRQRWNNNSLMAQDHHRLAESLAIGGVMLHWHELPKEQLCIAESVLRQIHLPPWNSQIY